MSDSVADKPEGFSGVTCVVLGYFGKDINEGRPGKPDALLKWFYPGRETGNEFVYSKQEEKSLAQDTQQTIVANQHTVPNSETSGAGN